MLRLTSLLLVAAGAVNLVEAQKNDFCYICSDGGVSTITLPDVLIPLPEFTGYTEATCETIRAAGEDARIIPDYACSLLDREDFRIMCGCENTLAEEGSSSSPAVAPTKKTTPVAAPIAVPAPIAAPTPVPIAESDAPSLVPSDAPSSVPSDAPSSVPSDAPSSVPSGDLSEDVVLASDVPSLSPILASDAPSSVPSDAPSSVPSDVPSSLPSDVPSSLPSDVPSSAPSDAPSSVPTVVPSSVASDTPSLALVPESVATVTPSLALNPEKPEVEPDSGSSLVEDLFDWFSR